MKIWKPFPFVGSSANSKILNAAGQIQDGQQPGIMLFSPGDGWGACQVVVSRGELPPPSGLTILGYIPPYLVIAVETTPQDLAMFRRMTHDESTPPHGTS